MYREINSNYFTDIFLREYGFCIGTMPWTRANAHYTVYYTYIHILYSEPESSSSSIISRLKYSSRIVKRTQKANKEKPGQRKRL